jgi:hypothetical protein
MAKVTRKKMGAWLSNFETEKRRQVLSVLMAEFPSELFYAKLTESLKAEV